MFSLNGTLKKSGSVGRWETKQFIGMALVSFELEVRGDGSTKFRTEENGSVCFLLFRLRFNRVCLGFRVAVFAFVTVASVNQAKEPVGSLE